MNALTARSLIPGQKIKYWDDRIATVTVAYVPPIPPQERGEVSIVFDEDTQDPKSVLQIQDIDFMRAEPL